MAGRGKGLDGAPDVRAAGGLVWRDAVAVDADGEPHDTVEVVVIHRPRQDDWSFPKGKLDKGESFEEAAIREVEEETGLACELGHEVAPVRYRDGKGRLKLVRYWVMRPVEAKPWHPDDEVDRRLWMSVDEARAALTYPHDRALLETFVEEFDREHGPG